MIELDSYLKDIKPELPSFNINRVFFFDESNNIKKGIICFDGDNNDDLENTYFVLGGIALKKPLDFGDLLTFVGARQTPSDAKFRFFSFGKHRFEEAIKQKRLKLFFEYLVNNRILVHFDIVHIMHFAIVDILDSLIEENDINQEAALYFYKELQSDMTEVLWADYKRTHDFLCNYNYPNVPKESANSFINDLLTIYTENLRFFDPNDPRSFTKELLRQLIKAKRKKQNLIFLEDNEPFVVLDNLSIHYLVRAIEISDEKAFDNESSVIKYLSSLDPNYGTKLNMSFRDSKHSREIQISDVICGFVARLFNFLSHNDIPEIEKFIHSLGKDSNEMATLKLFDMLTDISNDESVYMLKKTIPLFIDQRFSYFIYLIRKQ